MVGGLRGRARRPGWRLWAFFLGSLGLLALSMLNLTDGLRFVSRPLRPEEVRIVLVALEVGEEGADPADRDVLAEARSLLSRGQVRAMDVRTFAHREERATLGYTDERGRILLNPMVCFGSLRTLGPEAGGAVHPGDQVRSLSILYHEVLHRRDQASEPEAYEAEWRFLRRLLGRLESRGTSAPLLAEVRAWEGEMAERVEAYVGRARMDGIRRRVLGLPG